MPPRLAATSPFYCIDRFNATSMAYWSTGSSKNAASSAITNAWIENYTRSLTTCIKVRTISCWQIFGDLPAVLVSLPMYLPQPAQAAIDEGLDITITPRLRNWKDLETLSNIGALGVQMVTFVIITSLEIFCASLHEPVAIFCGIAGGPLKTAPRLLHASISVRPDYAGDANTLEFSPTTKYGNHSYVDAVLFPIADAVREVATAKTKVEVTLALKAGASLFFYPSDWQVAKTQMQQRFLLLGSKLSPDNIKFGMGLSSKNICG